MTGASLLANENSALVSFSASPNHCISIKKQINVSHNIEETRGTLNCWNNSYKKLNKKNSEGN
jgi:hypothetical protein